MNNAVLDDAFLALAHPARRSIVARLVLGPATVGEATRGLAISKPAVTKHLKVLERAGIIGRRVEGRTHRLELVADGLADAAGWIELHRSLWESRFDAVERHLAKTNDQEEGKG